MSMEVFGTHGRTPRSFYPPAGQESKLPTGRAREGRDAHEQLPGSHPDIDRSIEELRMVAGTLDRKLSFTVNEELGRVVVKVIDAETDEVIKELPPEALQRVQERIREALGVLLDENA